MATIINGGASSTPTTAGPSMIVSVSDGALDANLKSLTVNIKPKQNLNGYSSPWPAGGGKNLCPKLVSSTTHGVTLTVADNGVATLTGQSDTTNQAFGWVDFSLPAGTYIASGGNANYTLRIFNVTDNSTLAIVNSTSANVSFTLSATKAVAAFIRADSAVSVTTALTYYPMVRRSTDSDATYVPYENVCPITGWTSVKGARAGVNILPDSATMGSWMAGGNATISGGVVTATGSSSDYNTSLSTAKMGLNLLDGTTYYTFSIWYKSTANFTLVTQITGASTGVDDASIVRSRYANWQSAPNLPNSNGEWTRYTYTSRTITPEQLTLGSGEVLSWFMRFYFRSDATISIKSVQLEIGQSATPYQDSSVSPFSVSLGRTVYGGTLDVVSGKLVVDRAFVTINGTEQYWYAVDNRPNIYNVVFTDMTVKPIHQTVNVISNQGYTPTAYNYATMDSKTYALCMRAEENSQWRVYLRTPNTTLAALKSALGAQPLQIVYPLATPQTYTLTGTQVATLLGENHIWSDAGEVTIEYYTAMASIVAVQNRSTKAYVTIPVNKIAYETYSITPNQMLDLDSYRSESGVLLRTVLSHTASKIEFNTPHITNDSWQEVWNIIQDGFISAAERSVKIKYYDPDSNSYKTAKCYVPDIQYTIRNLDEVAGVINYDPIRVAFIEY